MKKRNIFLHLTLAVTLLFSSVTYAAETKSTRDVPRDIPLGGSGQMEMVGTIEPSILSVTMPSFVPFDISSSLSSQNKVVSPRISVKNNSNVPVRIDVASTEVDISSLKDTTWSGNGAVGPNQIAIGLKEEETKDVMPKNLDQTKWLQANSRQNVNVMLLDAREEGAMYVVGTLGQQVPENNTFNVTPTFVVSRTSNN